VRADYDFTCLDGYYLYNFPAAPACRTCPAGKLKFIILFRLILFGRSKIKS